jgi:hypothetical protein
VAATITTATFESIATPRVTISSELGLFTAVVEVDGLDPDRDVSIDEESLGIVSLEPPTVQAKTHRDLIDGCQRAVQTAISSTTGERGGPAAMVMTALRVAIGVRGALRKLGEEI